LGIESFIIEDQFPILKGFPSENLLELNNGVSYHAGSVALLNYLENKFPEVDHLRFFPVKTESEIIESNEERLVTHFKRALQAPNLEFHLDNFNLQLLIALGFNDNGFTVTMKAPIFIDLTAANGKLFSMASIPDLTVQYRSRIVTLSIEVNEILFDIPKICEIKFNRISQLATH